MGPRRTAAVLAAGAMVGGLAVGCAGGPDASVALADARKALDSAGTATVATTASIGISSGLSGSTLGFGATGAHRFGAHPASDTRISGYSGTSPAPGTDNRLIQIGDVLYSYGFPALGSTGKPWQTDHDAGDAANGEAPVVDPMTFLAGNGKNAYNVVATGQGGKGSIKDTEEYVFSCSKCTSFDIGNLAAKGQGGEGANVETHVWLDGRNRPRKLTAHYYSVNGQTMVTIDVTMTFSGLGAKVDIKAPPPDETDQGS